MWQSVAASDIGICFIDYYIATIVFGISLFAVRTGQLNCNMVYAAFGVWSAVWLVRFACSLWQTIFRASPLLDKRKGIRRFIWNLLLFAVLTVYNLSFEVFLCAGLPETAVKALGRPAFPVLCVWCSLWCGGLVRRLWRRVRRRPGKEEPKQETTTKGKSSGRRSKKRRSKRRNNGNRAL